MNDEIKLPADLALLKRCRKMGFSAKQAERMVMELFRIESNMQNDTNAKFKELIAEIKELRSEMATKSEVKGLPTKADVAAAVAEAGKDRMTQFISWGLAVGLAVLAFIGGTFVP